jgi:hypothetical protein
VAVFNPQVPQGQDNMPDWTKVTKPTDSFVADKSTGLALSTAATGIEEGASIIDTTAKDIIKKDVRSTVEPIREDFTNTLVAARDQALGNVVPQPVQTGQGSTAQSLLPQDQPTVTPPNGISSGLDRIKSIQLANENGKVNDTYYDMRLKQAVTDLRAKYPGYVDFIDAQVSSITGINPANAYVQNLMQDINRLQTSKKSAVDTAINDAMKSGYPQSELMVKTLQERGEEFLPKFRDWYATQTMFDAQVKRQNLLRENTQANRKEVEDQRTRDFTNEAGGVVANQMNTLIKVSGVEDGKTAAQLLEDASNNPGKYNEVQMKEFATKLNAEKNLVITKLQGIAAKTGRDSLGNVYSYNSDITPEKVSSVIKNVTAYYDAMHDALWNGGAQGAGIAFYHAQRAAGMLADTKDKIYSGEAGEDIRTFNVLNTDLGPNWTAIVTKDMLKADVDKRMQGLFQARTQKARAQEDVKSGGNPYTFKDMAGEALSLEQNKQVTAQMRARYLNEGLKIIDDITDKRSPDQAKVNALQFFFSPQGQGTLSNFKDDQYDYQRNKNIPGRQTVWDKMTSDEVVQNVSRLAKTNPQLGQMYRNWIENEAGSQLYYKEIQNLNRYTGHDDLHFKYNDGENGGIPFLTLVDKNGAPVQTRRPTPGIYNTNAPGQDPEYMYRINESVSKINQALAGVARVEKGLGGNASERLLSFLINSQVNLGENWTGLPARMMDAIAASHGKGELKKMFEKQGKQ